MVGLILGTSEGKEILSLLNQFTKDIFVSTATNYGGELLQDYKYKILNTSPLDEEKLIQVIKENNIKIFIDASHPYAIEITKNLMGACKVCNIEYVRYDRPSITEKFCNNDLIQKVKNYEQLYDHLKDIKGTIFNTTGSRNIEKIINLGIENRIVHRVLPSIQVLDKCFKLGIKVEDLIAIKGAVSFDINYSFFKEYKAKALILKDSGKQGGTEEKIKAALALDMKIFVIERSEQNYKNVFYSEQEAVQYVRNLIYSNLEQIK